MIHADPHSVSTPASVTPSSSNPGAPSLYRPALDGVRAVAFLMVFLVHAAGPAVDVWSSDSRLRAVLDLMVLGGSFGVPLFFVLSAFLVTHLLLAERGLTGTISVRDFIIRRSLRIWPLYYLLIGAFGVFYLLHRQMPGVYPLGPKALLAYSFFMGDFLHMVIPPTILGPLWSLSIEEKFYLVWPTALKRVSNSHLRLVAFGIITAGFLSRILLSHSLKVFPYWVFPLNHLDSFGYGILLATIPIRRVKIATGWAILFLMVGFTFAYSFKDQLAGPDNMNNVGFNIALAIAALVSAAFLYMVRGAESGILTSRPMRELGKRTYAAYVFHLIPVQLVIIFVPDRLSIIYLCAQVLAFGVTLVFAWSSYQWIEKPFLLLKHRFERVVSRPI